MKSGNDITREDIFHELESYDIGKKSAYPTHDDAWFFRPILWSGSATAGEIFDDSGVVILTNGLVFRETYSRKCLYECMCVWIETVSGNKRNRNEFFGWRVLHRKCYSFILYHFFILFFSPYLSLYISFSASFVSLHLTSIL